MTRRMGVGGGAGIVARARYPQTGDFVTNEFARQPEILIYGTRVKFCVASAAEMSFEKDWV